MKQLVHGSTFSGIGGPELAAEMLGWQNAFHCEINPFGRKILEYYYPNAKSYEDITTTNFSEWRGKIDVLTGGFPCQPFSTAGRRRGAEDDRYLWPYMLRCIDQVRPTWFVGENVAGIITMVLPGSSTSVGCSPTLFDEGNHITRTEQRYVIEEICHNLESIGYSVQPMLVPACAVGAPHKRHRVFFIAHNERDAIADTHLRDDRPKSRNDGCPEEAERLQDRCSSEVRPEVQSLEDSMRQRDNGRADEFVEHKQRPRHSFPTSEDGQTQLPSPDTSCGRGGTQVACEGSLGERRDGLPVESQRSIAPQWTDGLHQVSWNRCRWWGGQIYKEQRWRGFPTQSPICRGNDGIPFDVDRLAIPFNKWREESLKAFGNAIVPQVMYEIFYAIEMTYE